MKKFALILATVSLVGSGMMSCKKGENDPFLSLRSRKGRVAGEWTMANLVNTSTTTSNNGDVSKETTTLSGTTLTLLLEETASGSTSSNTINGTVNTATINFDKDGTWEQVMDLTTVTTSDIGGGVTVEQTQNTKTVTSGTWNFLSKVDEYKNKERMILNTLVSVETTNTTTVTTASGASTTEISSEVISNTYADGESAEVWAIDQLKNKEMIIFATFDNTYTNTDGSVTTTTANVGRSDATLTQD